MAGQYGDMKTIIDVDVQIWIGYLPEMAPPTCIVIFDGAPPLMSRLKPK